MFDDFDDSAYWQEPDFILADLVATLVNRLELPFGVTLFLKGMVISGVLVSEREYLQSLTDTFNSIVKREDGQELSEEEMPFDFTMMAESEPIDLDLDGDDDEEIDPEELAAIFDAPPIRHLHLKDVMVLNPDASMSFDAGMLRIIRLKLTAIDGWMLGQATNFDASEANGGGSVLH